MSACAGVALLALAGPVAADVHERDILLWTSGQDCDHDMETKKVKLHTNENKEKKRKKDVVVWQVINDCHKRQMVAICVDKHLLDRCVSLPSSLGADVNNGFPVEKDERVSLVCRGATVGKGPILLRTGDSADCNVVLPKTHVIDIEVVP